MTTYLYTPYIFCPCTENKSRSYKILILLKNPSLCQDSANLTMIKNWEVIENSSKALLNFSPLECTYMGKSSFQSQ